MSVGSLKDCDRKPHRVKRRQDPAKALRVLFTYDIKLLHKRNVSEKLGRKIERLIIILSSRALSMLSAFSFIPSPSQNSIKKKIASQKPCSFVYCRHLLLNQVRKIMFIVYLVSLGCCCSRSDRYNFNKMLQLRVVSVAGDRIHSISYKLYLSFLSY